MNEKRIIAIGRRVGSPGIARVDTSEPIRIETVRGVRTALDRVFGKSEKRSAKP